MRQNAPNCPQLNGTSTAKNQTPPKLLISVKSAYEASMALQADVDWIDLKSPEVGPLGAPSIETAKQVAAILADFSNRSVALGELHQLNRSVTSELTTLFPVAKVGLSRLANQIHLVRDFVTLASSLAPSALVPVLYADNSSCHAPASGAIITLAAETSAPYLLIDTFTKDGRGLLDWMPLEEIADVIAAAREIGCETVLAGSLKLEDIPCLLELSPAALAFRGAACRGERTDSLCKDRMQALVKKLKNVGD